jgi:NADH-quinone oxidoreductase subunit N
VSPALTVVLVCTLAGVVLLGLFPNLLVSVTAQAVPTLK